MGYAATRFAALPVQTRVMGRAARHPLCTRGRGAEGDRGAVWVLSAASWRPPMLRASAASVCADVRSVPGACPGSRMCLVAQDWKCPVQPLGMGEPGRPRLGLCLGSRSLGTTLVTSFSSGSAGSFPPRVQGTGNHPVRLRSRSELLRADGCGERV